MTKTTELMKTTVEPQVPFLDAETEAGLGWAEVWAMFSPLTPYGMDIKKGMQPCRPGQEEELVRAFRQLLHDAQVLRPDTLEELEKMLRELPDIRSVIHTLGQPSRVLGMKDLLALKKFVWAVWATIDQSDPFTFTSTRPWFEIRSLYGTETGTSLSIGSIGGNRIREASEAYSAALARRARVDKAVSDDWMTRTGYRPSRERQLVIPIPHGRDTAMALKRCEAVEWLRDTPFESVFEVLQTDEQKLATKHVESAEGELAAAQDEVLRLFSVELRNRLDGLSTMVHDIAQLDIRLAKVRMLERMSGCVPEIADASVDGPPGSPPDGLPDSNGLPGNDGPHGSAQDRAQDGLSDSDGPLNSHCAPESSQDGPLTEWHQPLVIEGAVHPIAKRQRESHGATFHPFDWSIRTTLNVLCGPNMGGKTVAMQTWCILQGLAQFGLPVPAKRMRTRLFDAIRFSSSAETNVQMGLSAFGREMVRVAEVSNLLSQTKSFLVCFDEPCRSTSPMEGEALAKAITSYFRDCMHGEGLCLITTHYTGVLAVPGAEVFQVSGWDEAFEEFEKWTHHTIKPVAQREVNSFAIRTAELLGVPHSVIERARSFGKGGQQDGVQTLSR